jgi:hypothetical protein
MKDYPSIPYIADGLPSGEFWYVFDKLDGSNIRAEWSRKKKGGKATWRFGRRHGLLDDTNEFLPEAQDLIRKQCCGILEKLFWDRMWERATAFFEFRGENSFAGHHQNEEHTVTLIDVAVYKKGLLEPGKLIKMFGDLPLPGILFRGQLDEDDERELIERIHADELEGVTSEGVVFKSARFERKLGHPLMFKVKTEAWKQRLKEFVGGDEYKFKKLL